MLLLKSEKATVKNFNGEIIDMEMPIAFESLLKFNSPLLILNSNSEIIFFKNFSHRLSEIVKIFNPVATYSKFFEENLEIDPPTFKRGSVRDNFYFGEIFWVNVPEIKKILKKIENIPEALLKLPLPYPLILLSLLENEKIFKIEEPLYEVKKLNKNSSHFDYTYKNLNYHTKCEEALNFFLKEIKAFIPYENLKEYEIKGKYEYKISVIIPVKNREKTIKDAITSALSQNPPFKFNVLVINNHSSDKTGEIVEKLCKKNKNLFHLIPKEKYLKIGGCWQLGINFEKCGKYAVQLDSDDLYSKSNVLEKIVEKFEAEKCGMVVGSYQVVDFNLKPILKELISHREWNKKNGHNNLLRVNGIGAPRAYVTEILRNEFKFPDVSYGEDYGVALAISGKYKVERIFENLYLCRRWNDNTDSNIDKNKLFRYDEYKDFLREIEIERRIKRNFEGE